MKVAENGFERTGTTNTNSRYMLIPLSSSSERRDSSNKCEKYKCHGPSSYIPRRHVCEENDS